MDTAAIDAQITACKQELQEIGILMRAEIQNNASRPNQQGTFEARYKEL